MLKYGMIEKENKAENTADLGYGISQIIIEMNFRGEQNSNLDSESIREKIYSYYSNKRGLYWEITEEWEALDEELTPDLACKMADVIYYTSQKECPGNLKSEVTKLEKKIRISHEEAQEICILKYRYRLENPLISKNYKQIELDMISDFLNNRKLNFLP